MPVAYGVTPLEDIKCVLLFNIYIVTGRDLRWVSNPSTETTNMPRPEMATLIKRQLQ